MSCSEDLPTPQGGEEGEEDASKRKCVGVSGYSLRLAACIGLSAPAFLLPSPIEGTVRLTATHRYADPSPLHTRITWGPSPYVWYLVVYVRFVQWEGGRSDARGRAEAGGGRAVH